MSQHKILKNLGNNIKYYRLKKGLSQEGLAEISDLHRTYIGSVERGERNISLLSLEKIARALKLSSIDLLKERHG